MPKIENRSLVACSFSSVKFENRAPENHVLLRAFVGGAFGQDFFNRQDPEVEKMVLKDLTELLGIKNNPLFSLLSRFPKSMVQYRVGHLNLISEIEKEAQSLNGLFLTGSAYRGVGIPDCVYDAELQAGKIFQRLAETKKVVIASEAKQSQIASVPA